MVHDALLSGYEAVKVLPDYEATTHDWVIATQIMAIAYSKIGSLGSLMAYAPTGFWASRPWRQSESD
jgi:hypothetical protein